MGSDVARCSVTELEARYVRGDQPVTPQLLTKLRRDPRRGVQRLYVQLRKRHERQRSERLRLDALLNFERVLWKSGLRHVAGVDEAGTGPLAGPVVAAAVVFPPGSLVEGVDDSKRLDAERRAELAAQIRERASGIGIGLASVEEIDRHNVYRAALEAMRRAVLALPVRAEHVLVDARTIPALDAPQNAFQKGDGLNYSIAAASIIAKTHRDRLMVELDARYPGYGFAGHKGYATAAHRAAIGRLGPSPVHRMSFPVLRELRGECSPHFYALRERIAAADRAELLREIEAALEAGGAQLGESEHRKLRLLLGRRWKAL